MFATAPFVISSGFVVFFFDLWFVNAFGDDYRCSRLGGGDVCGIYTSQASGENSEIDMLKLCCGVLMFLASGETVRYHACCPCFVVCN